MKYKSELTQLVTVANNTLKRHNSPTAVSYDHITNSGYRLKTYNEESDIERELSPRMSIKNLIIWLNGFIEGLDY